MYQCIESLLKSREGMHTLPRTGIYLSVNGRMNGYVGNGNSHVMAASPAPSLVVVEEEDEEEEEVANLARGVPEGMESGGVYSTETAA